MQACHRCGRWVEPRAASATSSDPAAAAFSRPATQMQPKSTPQQGTSASATAAPPLPLAILSCLPAAAETWSRKMDHTHNLAALHQAQEREQQQQQQQQQRQNPDMMMMTLEPSVPPSQVPPSPAARAGGGVADHNNKSHSSSGNNNKGRSVAAASASMFSEATGTLDDDDESFFCNFPDCAASTNAALKTDTTRAVTEMEAWEFAAACGDCGRVWPVPVPHPSAMLSHAPATMLSRNGHVPLRATFVCADYPLPWKQALEQRHHEQSSPSKGQTKKTTVAAAKKSSNNTTYAPCPSLVQHVPGFSKRKQQQMMTQPMNNNSKKNNNDGCNNQVDETLPLQPIFSSAFQSCFAGDLRNNSAAAAPKPSLENLVFVAGAGLPVQEKLRETTVRVKTVEKLTRTRMDLTQSGADVLPDTPVLEGKQRGDFPPQDEEQQQKPVVDITKDLTRRMREHSVLAARAGFVGVTDAQLPAFDPSKKWKHTNQRRGSDDDHAAAADGGVAAKKPAAPKKKAAAGGKKESGKRRQRAENDAAAAAAVEKKDDEKAKQQQQHQQPPQQVEEDVPRFMDWQTCDSCGKWRVLGTGCDRKKKATNKKTTGPAFVCSNLLDGTTCDNKCEGELEEAEENALFLRRHKLLKAAGKL